MVNLGRYKTQGPRSEAVSKLPGLQGIAETHRWSPQATPALICAATLCTENKVHLAVKECYLGRRNQQITAQTDGDGACWGSVISTDLHDDWDLKGPGKEEGRGRGHSKGNAVRGDAGGSEEPRQVLYQDTEEQESSLQAAEATR